MVYSSIRIEGNIISSQILDKLEQGDYAGQGAKDYGFETKLKVKDDIQFAWVTAKDYWKIFQRKLDRLPPDSARTSETRNDWIRPLLELLGYKLEASKPETVGEKSYAISNRAANLDGFPIHIIGFQKDEKDEKNDLDRRQQAGGAKMSAHGMVQEYLNLTEHLYAIVTNGRYLRVLRDSGRIVKLSFLEFDLYRMMEDDLYADFALLYRLLHSSRMPRKIDEGESSLIERYHQDSLDAGSRIREKLSTAVERSILSFAEGFLTHPANGTLITAIERGDLTADKMYQELLRLIYRFLFLMVTEERRLIYSDENDPKADVYYKFYSVERLRILSEKRLHDEDRYDDLWQQLVSSFKFFEKKVYGEKIGILPLDGDLFGADALLFLSDSLLKNNVLLTCLRNLCTFEDERQQTIRVNYGSLDVEEFGSVYEGLLEYDAVLSKQAGKWTFSFKKGEGRSSSGSHYTPEELVQPLIKHSLDYVIEEKLKSVVQTSLNSIAKKGKSSPHASGGDLSVEAVREAKRNALLSIKVCDVACGSGHILLSAARRIATVLAQVITDEEQPSPKAFRTAMRDVIRHCIYGVDKNPLAVELCKVALWLEAHNPGMPLTFLDHRIKCGDSIVGLGRKEELENGIATEAFKTLPGDDKEVASAFRKKNESDRKERLAKQQALRFDEQLGNEFETLLGKANELQNQNDDTVEDFHRKRDFYEKMQGSEYWRLRNIADIHTSQYFITKTGENKNKIATDSLYFEAVHNKQTSLGDYIYKATALSVEKKFFHWFLEFPEVFEQDGFDCILGNPPFLSGQKISGSFGDYYLNWMKQYFAPIGAIDMAGFFFRRAFQNIHDKGYFALLATNSIAQGDTRRGSLTRILSENGVIVFAIKSQLWPGNAAVAVSSIAISKTKNAHKALLEGVIVETINDFLDEGNLEIEPFKLKSNQDRSFLGSIPLGMGFVLSHNEADTLLINNLKNKEVIFPFINGEDLNSDYQHKPSRSVIFFYDWPIERAKQYTQCFKIIEDRVKPERLRPGNKMGRDKWWLFYRPCLNLYNSIKQYDRVLVCSEVSKYLCFVFKEKGMIYSLNLDVFALDKYYHFALLSSNIHEAWARKYCSTLESRLKYSPGNAFETFPFSNINSEKLMQLEHIGEVLYELRKETMSKMQLGLTKTYNLFHNPRLTTIIVQKESNQLSEITEQIFQDILKLRLLHKDMDELVVKAYGWNDLNLEHGFHEVEYLPENDRVRYTISEKARKEVLRRLLELNHKIHEEEVKAGLWEEKKGKVKPKKNKIDTNTTDLFEVSDDAK